jgi:exonuclease 3'-5' domain-containing protein 1
MSRSDDANSGWDNFTSVPPSYEREIPVEECDRVASETLLPHNNHYGQRPAPRLIDDEEAVSNLVDDVHNLPSNPPCLYLDLEGVALCRHGTIAILQVYVLPTDQTYLVDVHILGDKAFSTPGKETGRTLRDILQSPDIPKVFFDVRNDADALHHLYHVRMRNVQDLQLMELAQRRGKNRKYLRGLGACIDENILDDTIGINWSEAMMVKTTGKRLFAPEHGGSYDVFLERPLNPDIIAYCALDVYLLPLLWEIYSRRIVQHWWKRIRDESQRRVDFAFRPFDGNGRHMAQGPTAWLHYDT